MLASQIEQTTVLLQDIGVKPTTAVVDLGYRGVDHLAHVNIVHRRRYRATPHRQRRWLQRRQAIEPTIGHAKQDHGMRRCRLKGSDGYALHAALCAASFNNIRWLLRAIARLGLRALSLVPIVLRLLHGLMLTSAHISRSRPHQAAAG
jgi:IS5 family transposase